MDAPRGEGHGHDRSEKTGEKRARDAPRARRTGPDDRLAG
jgi:hypothetical protein